MAVNTQWVPTLEQIRDSIDPVDSATMKRILSQYEQREQHLFEKIADITAKDVLISFEVPLSNVSAPSINDVVYYKKETGLERAIAEYSTSLNELSYSPSDSCFVFGIVKTIATNVADVYTHGMIKDISVSALLQTGDTFRAGPYYLSKTEPGKITSNPAGVPIYVGYAVNANTFFISPYVHEALSFFLGFKYELLDRPTNTPLLTGSTWTIPSPDYNRLGWVPAAGEVGAPVGAVFKYNIPQNVIGDTQLSAAEVEAAVSLRQALPPWPFTASSLNVNGVEQKFRENGEGIFQINQFGIWWFNNQNGYQPWASDFVDWTTDKGSDFLRPRLLLSFIKVNPELKKSVVTSLTPSSNRVSIRKLEDPNVSGTAGDLLLDVAIDVETGNTDQESGFAVKDIELDGETLTLKKGPVVSSVTGVNGITAVSDANGNVTISNTALGLSGVVDSIEPENGATVVPYGLHSFLQLPNPATLQSGFVGKIQLPSIIPNSPLRLILTTIGLSNTGTQKQLAFDFAFSTSGTSGVLSNAVASSSVTIPLPSSSYTAYTVFNISSTTLQIPFANLAPSGIVNFRITRKVPVADTYAANIGILAVNWAF